MFAQLVVNSLIAGAIYSLVASGFSLTYAVCRFANFAHGVIITFAAYILYLLFSVLGLNFYLAVLGAILAAIILGYLTNLLIYKPLRKRKASGVSLLMSSFALLLMIESLIQMSFGASVKTIGYIEVRKGMEFLGAIITPLQLVIIIVSVLLLAFLFLFMKKTNIGKAMRAVADNKDVAKIVGISVERVYIWVFVVSSAIAGIAGILVSLEQNLEPTMGTGLIIKGFIGAIIGGIGSVPGAILGSFLLGTVENFGIWYLPSGYKDAIAFTLLFVFLLFRHQGILGIKRSEN
ncbi:branched-chain amino acid ABC transporter permease [Patescibacteria group bacterium]|nr:branched-chain amino acid ABC transporter permease [Patescibacteria group bacterium]